MSGIYYKYRGVEPWEYLLDILINKRLYAASFTALNDPMEGVFTYSRSREDRSFIEQMILHKMRFGVCSLSRSLNNTLMWSYYADSHRGLFLGVQVDPAAKDVIEIRDVDYASDNIFIGFAGSQPETEAIGVLSTKYSAWTHEQETRVFSAGHFVPITLVSVYFGCQMPSGQKTLLRSLLERLEPSVKIHEINRSDLDSVMFAPDLT